MLNASAEPLDIVLFTRGLAISGEDPLDLSLGGSETAVVCMARALARLGHPVTVLCNTHEPRRAAAVDYLPHQDIDLFAAGRDCDVFLSCRYHEILDKPIPANLIGLWNHDMPGHGWRKGKEAALSKASFHFFLSRFHRDQYALQIPGLAPFGEITSNGVDFDGVNQLLAAPPRQDSLRFIYASRPERGLDFLLEEIWPRLSQRYPDAELLVTTYDASSIKISEKARSLYRRCQELIRRSPGVRSMGNLTRREFWRELLGCRAVLYPTDFPEISCMVGLEAQALGIPVITTDAFALSETVGFHGTLVQEACRTPEYVDSFVDRAVRLIEDEIFFREARSRGRAHVARETHSWDAIARAWTELFHQKFEDRFELNKAGILRKLIRFSDLAAARRLVASVPDPERVFDPADLDRLRRRGRKRKTELHAKPTWIDFDDNAFPSRIQKLHRLIDRFLVASADAGSKDEKSILDVGCFTGQITLPLLKNRPHLTLTGIDGNRRALEVASQKAADLGVADRARFVYSDGFFDLRAGEYDIVLLGEILEHFEDPRELLEWAESRARLGVVGSVPYGPWEALRPDRFHLHHLRFLDLRRLISDKKTPHMRFLAAGETPRGEAVGNWVFSYYVDDRNGRGRFDLDSKIVRTAPLPRISATLIVKNEEANLRRCVESFEDIADEIILGDTGSTDNTPEIAAALGFSRPSEDTSASAKSARTLVDITFEDFAQARNELARYADADYIFWQDADEVLVNGKTLRRWVDQNVYFDALILEQRHASLKGSASADTPVRCFRPTTSDGPLRWVGCVHELVEHGGNRPAERGLVVPDVFVAHIGYLYEELRFNRVGRNWKLLRKDRQENPDRYMGYIYGMRDYLNLAKWELKAAGVMTRKAYRCLNQGFEIWHRHIRSFPPRFRSPGFKISREILAILAYHRLKLRLTDRIPFQTDLSFAACRGILGVDGRVIPRERELYASVEELREKLMEKLDRLDGELGRDHEGALAPGSPAKTARYAKYEIEPELFGLEPWPEEGRAVVPTAGPPRFDLSAELCGLHPANVSAANSANWTRDPTDGPLLVVAVATIPSRLSSLERALASLRRQTRPPDRILVVAPQRCRNPFGILEQVEFPDPLPTYLEREPIAVIRPSEEEDLGALNKIIHPLRWLREHLPGDHYLVTSDDDGLYAPDLLETLVACRERNPACVVCTEGGTGFDGTVRYLEGPVVEREQRVLVAQTGSGTLFSTDMFEPEFLTCEGMPPEAQGEDDWWISGYLTHRGITKVHVAGAPRYRPLPEAHSEALHREGAQDRLLAVLKALVERYGIWGDFLATRQARSTMN